MPSSLVPRPLLVWLTLGLVTVAFACVPGSTAEAQTIYKYTDKNGVVVLTDKPPKGVSAEPIVSGKPAAAIPSGEEMGQGGSTPPPGSMTAEEAIRQRDQKLDEVLKTVETRDRAAARGEKRASGDFSGRERKTKESLASRFQACGTAIAMKAQGREDESSS